LIRKTSVKKRPSLEVESQIRESIGRGDRGFKNKNRITIKPDEPRENALKERDEEKTADSLLAAKTSFSGLGKLNAVGPTKTLFSEAAYLNLLT
jgi:hypothetical protein